MQPDFTITPALLQQQAGIWVLNNSTIPAVLIECGYMTNTNDVKILRDDAKVELIARNILQGVAMYANDTFDKSKLFQLQNKDAGDTSVPAKTNAASQSQTPLYVLDGKIVSKEIIDKLDPKTIESINVLKDKTATDKYGDKGINGVVEITSKKS